MLKKIAEKLRSSNSILLTTHRHCDGDGLGAEIALYHALKKAGKKVRVLNVDGCPKRYGFLNTASIVQAFDGRHDPIEPTDIALILDTNDRRLVDPLFPHLRTHCREIAFIDHHPVLTKGPKPTAGSVIDTSAASTGEIAYRLIYELGIALDPMIARALYASLVFDTQLFRYIRGSAKSHLIAAELLRHEAKPHEVHSALFSNHTPKKVAFLAKALGSIEYHGDARIALLRLSSADLLAHDLDLDESRDVIDMVMNIDTLEAAALFREDGPGAYKLSLRSKSGTEVLTIAESVGGGGHLHSAGAYLTGPYEALKDRIVGMLLKAVSRTADRAS